MYDNREKSLDEYIKARKEKDRKNQILFVQLEAALQIAELKHPVFATSFDEGLLPVVEELGEIAASRNKGQGVAREREEVLDLLVVVWRLARGDWQEGV